MTDLNHTKSGGNLGSAPTKPLCLLGMGHMGINVLDQIVLHGSEPVDTVAIDTDQQVIEASVAGEKLLLGARLTRGLGCTGDLLRGLQIWRSECVSVERLLRGRREVLIVAGLGGGTGSAFAVEAAKLARSAGLRVGVLCTVPFSFETAMRQEIAKRMLSELRSCADVLITVDNERTLAWPSSRDNLRHSYHLLNQLLAKGMTSMAQIFGASGMTPLEPSDLQALYGCGNRGNLVENCWIGAGDVAFEAGVGELLEQTMNSALLARESAWDLADSCLACLSADRELPLTDLQKLSKLLEARLGGRTSVRVGVRLDPMYQGRIKLTLLLANTKGVFAPVEEEEVIPIAAPKAPTVDPLPVTTVPLVESATPPAFAQEARHPAAVSEVPKSKIPPEKRLKPKLKPEPVVDVPVQQEAPLLEAESSSVPFRKLPAAGEKKKASRQEELPFENNRGRFDNSFETIYRGENLDQPTFRRQKLAIKL